jgi:putative glutamine amidotransferase
MRKPLIGLTSHRKIEDGGSSALIWWQPYVRAVVRAGGLPVLIPFDLDQTDLSDFADRLDGLLLCGGGDVDLDLCRGEVHPKIDLVDLERDRIELALANFVLSRGVPVLGVCRGHQILNIALGGSLFTHLADQLPGAMKHDYFDEERVLRDHLAHFVKIAPHSRLAGIFGCDEIMVNSLHHQGIKDIAPDLIPTAWAPDGLVEGVELKDHPFAVGVQWHPECLVEVAEMHHLFRAFIAASNLN